MMNFIYDPIMGLQYSFGDLFQIVLDINMLPNNLMSFDEAIALMNTKGVVFTDPCASIEIVSHIHTNI